MTVSQSPWGLVGAPVAGPALVSPALGAPSYYGWRGGLLVGGEVASGLPALLFGARRGPPGERSLPRLGVEGPGTACSGSSCCSSCSSSVGTRAEGGLPGPPRRAADELLGGSSAADLSGLLEGAGLGAGDPLREAVGPGAAAGLPSCSSAARASSRPIRRRASPLHRSTMVSIRRRTKILVCTPRAACSSWNRVSSSRPKRCRTDRTSLCAADASQRPPPKISRSSCRSQSRTGRSRAESSRKRNAQMWGWRPPTGALGTSPAADGWDAAGRWRLWAAGRLGARPVRWTTTDGAADGVSRCSSKLSSARTECKMDVAVLLQRG